MGLSIEKIKSSLSADLVAKLNQDFGQNRAAEVFKAFGEEKSVSVRVNTLKATIQEIMEVFRVNGITFQRTGAVPNSLIVTNKKENSIEKLDIYKLGKIYLQNLSSQVPVLILDPKPGEKVLDMCSAPGSKTTQIAAMMQNSGVLVANEIDQIRFEKLKHNINMQGVKIAELELGNAVSIGEKHPEKFDKILLDVPCSAEGKINIKEPRTHKFWSEKVVRENAKLQHRLILSGLKSLRSGGLMVYSTCSLMRDENDDIIEFAVGELGKAIRVERVSLELSNSVVGKYGVTILPNAVWEGFYCSRIVKV